MTAAIKLFGGTAHPAFTQNVAACLGIIAGDVHIRRFSDGETYAMYNESVRGADCFIIQPTCPSVDQHIMELLILLDALRRASAARITAVVPYYGYARQEKKIRPREPITAKLVADLITHAGANRIMTMDLHSDAIQGFFNFPVDHLTALKLIGDYFEFLKDENVVFVSPDEGRVKKVRKVAAMLDKPIAVGFKHHPLHEKTEITHLVGDVKDKIPIIIEDMITTGGSVEQCVNALLEQGCKPQIYVAATHGVLVGPAFEKLNRPEIAKVIVTDTIPFPKEKMNDRFEVISVAPLFAESIKRAHENRSISSLFDD